MPSKFLLPALIFAALPAHAQKTLQFGDYEWIVKNAPLMGPGPNAWDEKNVWLDEQGRLHLKITQRDGKWYCAELHTKERLGFGRYQWQVIGRLDQLDPQIVLGLFPYTRPDVGPDGTNEIDIEFARWGRADTSPGNFNIWPPQKGVKGKSARFDFELTGTHTTSRFLWSAQGIQFQMLGGHRDDDQNQIINWNCTPNEPKKYIPQNALPLHINFWLFGGKPPQNAREAEIIISNFSFVPLIPIHSSSSAPEKK